MWPDKIDRLQMLRINEIDIINVSERRLTDRLANCGDDSCSRSFAVPHHLDSFQQSFVQNCCLFSLFRIQVSITRTACQPVLLANGRHSNNVDLEIEIADHAANDRELLKILFTKHRRIRRKNVEEFRDNGANSPEMSRPRFAFERAR